MSRFQIILLVVFGFFILVAVVVFALYKGNSATLANITVWGDIPAEDFNQMLSAPVFAQNRNIQIAYIQKPSSTIDSDFTEALASGNGPDLIIFTEDKFWKNRNKLYPIPYASISAQTFTDTFAEAGSSYLTSAGIYGLPLSIDPMVLYFDRDSLTNAGIAKQPQYWDEVYGQTVELTQRDAAGNIVKSAVALGTTRNIANYKDILSLLMLQAGTPITSFSTAGLSSALANSFQLPTAPADSALDFYTQFSNPSKTYYSWNSTLPEAQTRFASGDLAYYLGFSSELKALRSKNPTLNFAVSLVPQSRVSGKSVTIGKVRAVSISKGAKDPASALSAALEIISHDASLSLSQIEGVPSARRDILAAKPTDAIGPVFYDAALQAKSWVDPDSAGTAAIFKDMIDSVTSGRARTTEAVSAADSSLNSLISTN